MGNISNNLYSSEWLAIVFENRNQNYGAFKLRAQSSSILIKAFLGSSVIFIGLFLLPPLISLFRHETKLDRIEGERVINITMNDPIHQIKKELPKQVSSQTENLAKATAPKLKSVAMSSNIKVVKDELVQISPPTSAEIKDAVIANASQDGLTGISNSAVGDGVKTQISVETSTTNGSGDGIYEAAGVEVFPEFPGGMNAWAKFIQRNLRYPAIAQESAVQGKVFLSFVVEKDGNISDVKVLRGIGYGCDEEAIRVIKKSPRWKAGMQNNLPVRVRFQMPIAYTLN